MVKRERNIKTGKFARHRKINIVHYVTRQYMQINKKRTFTTFIGIMFMVMLMTCVFVGKDTAVKYLQSMAAAKQGSWHAIIYDVNKEKRNQVERLEGVDRAAASVDFGMAEFDRSNNEERPYLNFKAYEKDCFNWYNIMVTSGRLPQNKNEIIVSKACIDDGSNLKIGDTVEAEFFERTITGVQKDSNVTVFPYYGFEIKKGETLAPPQDFMYVENNEDLQENKEYTGKKETYTVVGFMKTPFFESENGAAYTAITYLDNETAKTVENINISLTFVFDMKNDAMSNLEELMDIVGDARLEYNDYVLMFSGDSSDSTFYLLVNIMTVFFVALIMLASIILIYNVFNLSFRERCRYLGMLSSVGATARQKRSNIYYEAFYLLVPALFAGILLGFVIIKAGMSMLKPFIAQFLSLLNLDEPAAVTLCINVKAILLIVIVSVVTVLISSFLPARKIGKIGAVESIRGNENQKNKIYRIQKRNIKWFGAEGLLAGAGLKRQGRKKKSISLSIIIFMVILLVTAFGSGAIHKVADNKTKNYNLSHKLKENQGCLSFLPDQSDLTKEEYLNKRRGYDTLKEELRNNPNVLNMQEISESMFVGSVDSGVLSGEYWDAYYDVIKQYYDNNYTKKEFEKEYKAAYNHAINVIAMDNKTLSDIADKTGADYESLINKERAGAIVINEATLSNDNLIDTERKAGKYRCHDIMQVTDLKQGDHFDVNIYSDKEEKEVPLNFQIAGFADNEQLKDYISVFGERIWIIISIDTAKRMVGIMGDYDAGQIFNENVIITVDNKHMEILNKLKSFEGDNSNGINFINKDLLEANKTMSEALVKIADIMLICFVLLASIICLMNIGNSIGGRMAERRGEFAVMQSVGMTRAQMRKMLMLECAGILTEGIFIALVISALLMFFIQRVFISLFGYITLKIPVALMLLAVVFTAAAVVAITLYSFARQDISKIRWESV